MGVTYLCERLEALVRLDHRQGGLLVSELHLDVRIPLGRAHHLRGYRGQREVCEYKSYLGLADKGASLHGAYQDTD